MLKIFPKLMLVVGIGITGAACQDDGNAAPRGYYQPAPSAYNNPYNNSGYYRPAPAPAYGYQPAPNYYPNQQAYNQQGYYGSYNQARYTSVTVTNRGQNGNRDDVVQQTVLCGSTYFDGYRNRIARC